MGLRGITKGRKWIKGDKKISIPIVLTYCRFSSGADIAQDSDTGHDNNQGAATI